LVARLSSRKFVELSAITAGVKDVREVMERARADRDAYGVSTILFLDEIHRFSKAQQDALLPGVENGWVVLIAATTENPSFSVISPLLSRSLMLTLTSLEDEDLIVLMQRAVKAHEGLAGTVEISDDLLSKIALVATGDARRALTILEAAAEVSRSLSTDEEGSVKVSQITEEHIGTAMDRALVRYDRDGDQHYDVISAFIKSVRGSDADAATHYLARMIEAGEDPRFIARRLIILAAEDIGLADPQALGIAVAAAEAVALIGMPEGRIPLSEATIYLCLAPKSNSAYRAINSALDDIRSGNFGDVPKPVRSSNHFGAKGAGAGVGYLYPHDDPKAVVEQSYLDEKSAAATYYLPKPVGLERDLAERWAKLREIIRGYRN
jgi:putative ATPase